MASVELRRVEKRYGATEAIRGIDLHVDNEEFVALVGPSGCGKSTLLRMIAGLEAVSGGQIEIGGEVVNDKPAKNRDIAMVFQNYALYPHKSVFENMAFSLRLRGAPRGEIERRVGEAATILNLTPLLQRQPRHLSGGERQRVAMGRAIVRNPKVFLFDEPLSNLDAKLRVQMRSEIRSLHQRLRATTVYVTHDQVEAMTMADRIAVMNHGRIEQTGKPLDLYDRPANLFVAGFIGSPGMNFFAGNLSLRAGVPVVRAGDIELPLPDTGGGTDGQEVIYGIRPEHIGPGTGNGLLTAVIEVVEPTGPATLVTLRLGDTQVLAVFDKHASAVAGAATQLRIETAEVHLFDAKGGRRL